MGNLTAVEILDCDLLLFFSVGSLCSPGWVLNSRYSSCLSALSDEPGVIYQTWLAETFNIDKAVVILSSSEKVKLNIK